MFFKINSCLSLLSSNNKIPYYFRICILTLRLHVVAVLFCVLLTTSLIAQDSLDIGDDDPYIDQSKTSSLFKPNKHFESPLKYILGISYGLHPIIILAPALSGAMYWDPMVIGFEISDSDHLGIWEKERRENLGPSWFSGET